VYPQHEQLDGTGSYTHVSQAPRKLATLSPTACTVVHGVLVVSMAQYSCCCRLEICAGHVSDFQQQCVLLLSM
jgi:hypothetical protein